MEIKNRNKTATVNNKKKTIPSEHFEREREKIPKKQYFLIINQ